MNEPVWIPEWRHLKPLLLNVDVEEKAFVLYETEEEFTVLFPPKPWEVLLSTYKKVNS